MLRLCHSFPILLFCVFSLTADAQFEQVFQLPLPERIKIIDTLYRQYANVHPPEEQQAAIAVLRKLALDHSDDQSLIKAEALQLEFEFTQDPAVIIQKIDHVFQLIQACRIKEYYELEVWLLIRAGDWLRIAHHLGVAINYFMQAFDMYPEVDSSYWPIPEHDLVDDVVGGLYSIEDYERAKKYMEKSYLMTRTGYAGMRTWDLLSQIYLKLGDYEQSEHYIHKAEEIYAATDTTLWPFVGWRGIFFGYYGKIRYFREQYHEAIPFFESAIRICDEAHQPSNVSSFGIQLAQCYTYVGEIEKARVLLPRIRHSLNMAPEDNTALDYYNLLLVVHEPRTTPERNRQILDSLKYWTNQYEIFRDSNQLARTELNQGAAMYKTNQEQMEKNISRQKKIRAMLLISLGFVVFASMAFIIRKQKQLVHSTGEAWEAKRELILLKDEMLKKIMQLEEQYQHAAPPPDDETLEILRTNPILTEEDWVRFKQLFEKAHHGFLERLKKQYPDLTQGEIRFIALIRLSLNAKEMASILGVGSGAMRTMKSRLLKKLSFSPDENLEEIISAL